METIRYTNQMYNFSPDYNIYLNKINNKFIFGHYLMSTKNPNKIYEVQLIYFKDINKITFYLDGEEYDRIKIITEFLTEDNNIVKYGEYAYIYKNFNEANYFVNLLVEQVYGKENKIFSEKMFTSNIDEENFNSLNNFEKALLTNSFVSENNICIGRKFNSDNMLVFYYNIQIINFANKKILVSFENQEGSLTTLNLYFFDSVIILKDNDDKIFNNLYSIKLLLINNDIRKKVVFSRLSFEEYEKLLDWFNKNI